VKAKLPPCVFIPGPSDHAPVTPTILCANCDMPESNKRHKVKPQSPELTEYEQRRIGERA
jgi:hypothetical protein